MLCHKMSLTMRRTNRRYCRRQFNNILMLSIIWTLLFADAMARPNLETALLSNKPTNNMLQQQQQQDLFLNELMGNTHGEKLFNKLKTYHHNQPNYLNKWPGLRELVLDLDYNDNNNNNNINNNNNKNALEDSNEFSNNKFFERLRQLTAFNTKTSESYNDDEEENADQNVMPSKSLKSAANQVTFKDHNIKKNVQYMSPCHFKICNMGRKRNARLFANY